MYEVLEVMRDRRYRERIFPVVINKAIYDVIDRVNYVKYWQQQYDELDNALKEIKIQNSGKLGEDLKIRQNIASNIAEFLDIVSDMNNPEVEDVYIAIKEGLQKIV